jgi:hypothetical protein
MKAEGDANMTTGAVGSGKGAWQQVQQLAQTDPTLQNDLQGVEGTERGTPEHRAAMQKLRQDAEARGIELPHHKGGAGKSKGGQDGGEQMVTVTDANGNSFEVPASEAASYSSGSIMSGGSAGVADVASSYNLDALPGANKYSGGV